MRVIVMSSFFFVLFCFVYLYDVALCKTVLCTKALFTHILIYVRKVGCSLSSPLMYMRPIRKAGAGISGDTIIPLSPGDTGGQSQEL